MHFLPILIGVGALAYMAGRKKKTSSKTKKALPPANDRGTIFEGDTENRPDVIVAKVGERFSVSLQAGNPSTGQSWRLAASPPDNSIEHAGTEFEELAPVEGAMPGAGTQIRYDIFEAKKAGKGSLVFHFQRPWLEGKEPPDEVVEILTEIS